MNIMRRITIFWVVALLSNLAFSQEETPFEPYEQTIPNSKITFKMTPIIGGEFLMGSPENEKDRKEDEGPQKKVKIEPFWMGIHEVTFGEYEIFREETLDINADGTEYMGVGGAGVTRPSPPYEDPTFGMGKYGYPAASMTQFAALMYCKWLSEKTGVFYRLPTEAEWEYACRAGTTTAYHFGDAVDSLNAYGWHYDNGNDTYHKVGEKKPNPWGLYDMHGNVAEWTLDQYTGDFYGSIEENATNPWKQPTKLHPRSVRGGSWNDDPDALRSAARTESSMNWKKRDPQIPKSYWWNTDSPFVGFRIIRPQKQLTPEEIMDFWMKVLDEG